MGWKETAKQLELLGKYFASVGWHDTAKYPDGTPVAYIASIMEYGAEVNVQAGTKTVHRNVDLKTGEFKNSGKFTTKDKSNFQTTHASKAHKIRIPPRPMMRSTIFTHSEEWSRQAALGIKAVAMGTRTAEQVIAALGELAAGDVRKRITDITSPPLAKSTQRQRARQGYKPDKPLVRSGLMLSTCTSEVEKK